MKFKEKLEKNLFFSFSIEKYFLVFECLDEKLLRKYCIRAGIACNFYGNKCDAHNGRSWNLKKWKFSWIKAKILSLRWKLDNWAQVFLLSFPAPRTAKWSFNYELSTSTYYSSRLFLSTRRRVFSPIKR